MVGGWVKTRILLTSPLKVSFGIVTAHASSVVLLSYLIRWNKEERLCHERDMSTPRTFIGTVYLFWFTHTSKLETPTRAFIVFSESYML